MNNYTPIITQAGLNAAVNAKTNGINIHIAEVAVGTQGYEPTRQQVALKALKNKVPVTGGNNLGDGQFHITAKFTSDSEYAVREVGFYLADGTLFAVWSHPSDVLFYQTPLAQVIQGFDLVLSAVPVDNIEVNNSGDLNLFLGEEFMGITLSQAQMAQAQIAANYRQIQFNDRLLSLGV
ncbi:phage tail-collar fiber domain-containing protein [Pseudoalteromonas sp. S16_S37]|uniref:phage tail-collar fiber domain-containing protein n=1 Tax=Pseudoalteromonas sp. S16_S37 TaxID=2720228 RepID=UPI001680D305|nr:phage tail protein [Pseudoalteromonas sp. S16_S37]MBD1582498.1 phage tail protein [Pseudoalteromonas sp. S16_S37]